MSVQTAVVVFADHARRDLARLDRHGFIDDALALGVVAHLDVTREREVLAERVPDEAVVGEDAAQVGVAFEDDAVEIEGLALVPVGTVPEVVHRGQHGEIVVGAEHAHAHALVEADGEQVRDGREALAFPAAIAIGGIVHATQVDELLEARLRSVAQGLHDVQVDASAYLDVMQTLRDAPQASFEQLIDLCGMDYSAYGDGRWEGQRFAAVSHLLSVSLNQRVRVRVFCADDDFPVLPSVNNLWNSANWYEREAFDLYGIVFEGHTDLRRILTDYGFIGHPFRKDFPLSGHVEMRYDAERQRVIYEPVTIEPREVTPRVIREDNYGGLH
eukprot:TRINITY_DN7617_c0_g1_i1.p2 TRINITY_DN7617_c0_g1~~TRINITY_DN7617_c0_g1_i1.p2  ORF type:complete len:329 (-),score=116.84 TRINITY_DN7617_c0_g1_i1:34-1020(-)